MTFKHFSDALAPGSKLLWFEIVRVLGKGGFGITYLGRDTNQDRLVAIKEYLPTTFASRTEDKQVLPNSPSDKANFEWGLERFLKEAQTLARFKHPAIVRVVSFFRDSSTAYMVMEYVEGTGLDVLLKNRKTLSEKELMKILPAILDGLEVLHDAHFIHRDLKPPNILIRKDGTPVILDFGSARQSMVGQGEEMTSLLSLGYSPFEQYDSSGERQGPWSDIYAMGGVLYRAIAGNKPTDAAMRIAARLRSEADPLKPAVDVGKGRYSSGFLEAVDQALQVLETERPQSIGEWRTMLGLPSMLVQGTKKNLLKSTTTATSANTQTSGENAKKKRSSWRSFISNINEFSSYDSQTDSAVKKSLSGVSTPGRGVVKPAEVLVEGNTPAGHISQPPVLRVSAPRKPVDKSAAIIKLGRAWLEPDTKIPFIWVSGGTFLMGSAVDEKGRHDDEGPVHEVSLKGFWMSRTPVTWFNWYQLMGDHPPGVYNAAKGNHPVERVSWALVHKFLARLTQRSQGRSRFRLPTEAEWEYAVRAGTRTMYPFEDGIKSLEAYAWVKSNAEEQSWPVATKKANPLGLYDLLGNVWEWVEDWYGADYYKESPSNDPQGPAKGVKRCVRGGCWRSQPRECRSANRQSVPESMVSHMVGFRLVRDEIPEE